MVLHHVNDEHLFLRSRSLILLGLRPLFPLTHQPCFAARVAQLPVCRTLTLEVGDLALLDGDLVADREEAAGLLDLAVVTSLASRLVVLGGCLTGLRRLGAAWEEDETLLVGFEPLDVGGEGLFGEVGAARVDRDTDGGCQLARDAGFLQCS